MVNSIITADNNGAANRAKLNHAKGGSVGNDAMSLSRALLKSASVAASFESLTRSNPGRRVDHATYLLKFESA
jgi:hypothetical protein